MTLILSLLACISVTVRAADLLLVEHLLSSYSKELPAAKSLGFVSTIVSAEEWMDMETKDFAAYKAIIISDPAPGAYLRDLAFLENTTDIWGPAVQGNIIIHGMLYCLMTSVS